MAIWYSIRKYLLKIHLIQPSDFPGQPITTEHTSILNGTQAVSCLSIRLQTKETHTHTQRVRTFPPVIYPVRYGHQTNVGTADSPFDTTYYRPERRTFVVRTVAILRLGYRRLHCFAIPSTRPGVCSAFIRHHPRGRVLIANKNRPSSLPTVVHDVCCVRARVYIELF